MLPAEVLDALRCPVCRGRLRADEAGLRCDAGHAFDRARQGYVNLMRGEPGAGADTAEMVAARAEVLAAGHFAPLRARVVALAAAHAPAEGLIVEVGAGTGDYLAAVVAALDGRVGLALDVSRYAARRAARVHPRVAAIVANAREALPLADGCAGLVLDIFAPRHAPELRRIVRSDGAVLVVTPTPEHLGELRGPLGLLNVDPEKERRLAATMGTAFTAATTEALVWTMTLRHPEVARMVAMGPSAHHVDPGTLVARVGALPDPVSVTASVRLAVHILGTDWPRP